MTTLALLGGTITPYDAKAADLPNSPRYGFVTSQLVAHEPERPVGWLGCTFVAAATDPPTVVSLGRYVSPGDVGKHLVYLVRATDMSVVGSAVVDTKGVATGTIAYSQLREPVTLQAGTSYEILSQEDGKDSCSLSTVYTTGAGTVTGSVAGGTLSELKVASDKRSYGPVSFQYVGRPCSCTLPPRSWRRIGRNYYSSLPNRAYSFVPRA